ncbi:hypothetical protein Mycsm_02616 [Mycobacterium sp. JS623]|uniref:SRPBCC family protein n=1 Tax=Mycobacterium sp. JS623 TaxID=212767 RepID=UPI0002A59F16|nr:SRPBCC domain-containing protein [Mycobacterium sp. JS623]AGB22951.1 hypothetical protein Mycsm_02616 [Mycobacterium sp. JS623]
MKLAVQQVVIHAPAERVFEYLIDPVLFGQWMAEGATLDAQPGGTVRWTHPNGDTVSGHYVEVDPPRRLVFTYGWERTEVRIPPGSTTVEIDLVTQSDGTTLVTLVHRGLEGGAVDAHRGGWAHYLDRLCSAAEGRPPGPDPWAGRRVPTPEEMAQ